MPTATAHPKPVRPKLGILAFNPIQYHVPLHQLLARREHVELDVLFLSDIGLRPTIDPGFGREIAWDIDLLSGYAHAFVTTTESPAGLWRRIWRVMRWLPTHDVVVVNGYNSPWMLLAMAVCWIRRTPYLLRASSHPRGQSSGIRRYIRRVLTRVVVAGSAGGLTMGQLNHDFYRQNRARSVTFAPNSVDTNRFALGSRLSRSQLLADWGLQVNKPVVLFCGKLIPRKRPLDLVAALELLPTSVTTLFVGDGQLAACVSNALSPGCGVVTGFVNQSDLPSYYHAADILVLPSGAETWGLVVNEAMACGVLPVVSDQVGCAPDLAKGVGEVFRCGDVPSLADALSRAVARLADPDVRLRVQEHVERYSIERTATGFEQAALAVAGYRSSATAVDA